MRREQLKHPPIRIDEVYTLDEFKLRTGLKRYSLKAAQRRGLRVIRAGSRVFVRGADWDDYLDGLEGDAPAEQRIGFRAS